MTHQTRPMIDLETLPLMTRERAVEAEGEDGMSDLTEITNILGDLDTYADELDGEGWHNAANACRYAGAEIERLRALLREALDPTDYVLTKSWCVRALRALEGK